MPLITCRGGFMFSQGACKTIESCTHLVKGTYPGFQINQYCPGNIPGVVALVVEDVLPIAALGRKVFQVTILIDSMLLTKLLPELTPNCSASVTVRRDCADKMTTPCV